MANPNHLPAGRTDGGQFTFAYVGGFVIGANARPTYTMIAEPNKNGDYTYDQAKAMLDGLRQLGVPDDEILAESDKRYGPAANDVEHNRNTRRAIADLYKERVAELPLMKSLAESSRRYETFLARGGRTTALGKDDGTFQLVYTTNNAVSTFMDSGLDGLRNGEAAVYNQRTGVLRRGAFCVPVGKAKKINATSTDRSVRNRCLEVSKATEDRQAGVAKAINDRIADPLTKEGRALGTDDYAGRMTVCAFRDDDGNLYIQDCILCEEHERGIADMYAHELGSSVMTANRPTEANSGLGGSNTGGVNAGVGKDTGWKPEVPEDVKQQMWATHDALKARREKEYAEAYGRPRPEKTEEQRARERANAKARRLRDNQAKEEAAAGREPIKVPGKGWYFQGEKGYEAAKGSHRPTKQMVADAQKEAKSAVEKQEKRQKVKEDARDRQARKRALDREAGQAVDRGLKAGFIPENGKANGRRRLVTSDMPEWREAKKSPHFKQYTRKKKSKKK